MNKSIMKRMDLATGRHRLAPLGFRFSLPLRSSILPRHAHVFPRSVMLDNLMPPGQLPTVERRSELVVVRLPQNLQCLLADLPRNPAIGRLPVSLIAIRSIPPVKRLSRGTFHFAQMGTSHFAGTIPASTFAGARPRALRRYGYDILKMP